MRIFDRALLSGCMATLAIAAMTTPMAAAPIVYFGENLTPLGTLSGAPVTAHNQFLSALAGVGTQSFEGLAGTVPSFSVSFPASIGSITATLTGTGGVCDTSSGTVGGLDCNNNMGRFPTSGISWFHTTAPGFELSFSSPISALGFYGTDIGDFSGQLTLTTAGGAVNAFTIPSTIGAPNGSLLFWGFIDPAAAYTSITFGATSGRDGFGFDDLIVGDAQQIISAIPEPAALLLFGMGLVGLGSIRYRRKPRLA